MDLLLVLTYSAVCVAIFKFFKIPLNKWTVPGAVLGGVLLIATLIFLMNYNHPYSAYSREYFVTTPIVPAVTGTVIEVPVSGHAKLSKGDVLFKIDPVPFQNKVDSLRAQVISAETDRKRNQNLINRKLISQRDLDFAVAKVDDLSAQLATAEFELSNTTVRAPTNGYVLQVALRPGMRATSLPLRPVMIFVHDEGQYYVSWFRQNSMLRLNKGDDAEVAFDGIPGRVFSGKVKAVAPVIVEGQIQATGNLYNPRTAPYPGRLPVVIDINDPAFEEFRGRVPGGAYGQTAIYTQHFKHVAVMRKVLLRMSAWMNYLFPIH